MRRTLYGGSRKEVADALVEKIHERNTGNIVYDDDLNFGEFLGRWLDGARHTVKATTWEAYERVIRNHINPSLGRVKLGKLSPGMIQAYYSQKLAEGMSAASVRPQHAVIRRSLAQAQRWQFVRTNPADAVDPPMPRSREMRPLDAAQARAFLDAARGERYEALFVLAISTGMRIGELLGLKWSDVDFDAGSLRVARTLSTAKTGPRYTTPKSGKGRNIKLPAIAIAALRTHRAQQNAQRLALGDAWRDEGLIFAARNGSSLDFTNITRDHFAPLLKSAGLPPIRFHDLRHTTATLLLSQGTHPKFVQELLGHASVAMTIDRYSHVLPGMGDATARALDAVLS